MIGATPEFREWFRGVLDEVCIFRRALTEDEIQALRNLAERP